MKDDRAQAKPGQIMYLKYEIDAPDAKPSHTICVTSRHVTSRAARYKGTPGVYDRNTVKARFGYPMEKFGKTKGYFKTGG
jgi:hypothetical protein